jgi:hypothetical protein
VKEAEEAAELKKKRLEADKAAASAGKLSE